MRNTLANFLLNLATRTGTGTPNRWTFRLRVRREDIARHLDLTPAGLEAEFERLVARRTISLTAEDTVTILDRAALATPRPERSATSRTDAGGEGAGAPLADRSRLTGRSRLTDKAASTPEVTLQAILADERFRAAPRTSTLLAYLVEKALAGEADELDGRRIAVEALGKPSGRDPTHDPCLKELVSGLREMLDEYHAEGSDHDFVIRVVPGSYRLVIQNLPPRRAISGGKRSAPRSAACPFVGSLGETGDRDADRTG